MSEKCVGFCGRSALLVSGGEEGEVCPLDGLSKLRSSFSMLSASQYNIVPADGQYDTRRATGNNAG